MKDKLDFKNYERDILIYAFRYALGRMTYSVSTVTEVIKDNWDELLPQDKALIKKEIKEYQESDSLGMDCDKVLWLSILRLKD